MRRASHFLLSILILFCVCAALTVASRAQPEIRTFNECEGDGCAQVTITWDDAKQEYKVQNNSADRWVRIEGANLVSNASLCLAPTKSDYLALKTIVGPLRANLAEEKCGKRTLSN